MCRSKRQLLSVPCARDHLLIISVAPASELLVNLWATGTSGNCTNSPLAAAIAARHAAAYSLSSFCFEIGCRLEHLVR